VPAVLHSKASNATQATERFFLVGFMGTGKTTLGRQVAERMGLPFVDLDERIERATGMSVPEIFAREGEDGFRRRESEALLELVEKPEQSVVATGGGAFIAEANRLLMKSAGVVVWLDVPIGEILARIEGGERPLWKTPEEVRALHERRRGSYQQAHHRLALDGAAPSEAAERLHRLLLGCRRVS
jgi:shikimate kinase